MKPYAHHTHPWWQRYFKILGVGKSTGHECGKAEFTSRLEFNGHESYPMSTRYLILTTRLLELHKKGNQYLAPCTKT